MPTAPLLFPRHEYAPKDEHTLAESRRRKKYPECCCESAGYSLRGANLQLGDAKPRAYGMLGAALDLLQATVFVDHLHAVAPMS
jgi:hypothetical protein